MFFHEVLFARQLRLKLRNLGDYDHMFAETFAPGGYFPPTNPLHVLAKYFFMRSAVTYYRSLDKLGIEQLDIESAYDSFRDRILFDLGADINAANEAIQHVYEEEMTFDRGFLAPEFNTVKAIIERDAKFKPPVSGIVTEVAVFPTLLLSQLYESHLTTISFSGSADI